MWRIILAPQANHFYESLRGKHAIQMENALARLAMDAYQGKPLKGELKGYWSYRVGIYRIIYTIKHHEILIEILRIQHRKDVYEKLRR